MTDNKDRAQGAQGMTKELVERLRLLAEHCEGAALADEYPPMRTMWRDHARAFREALALIETQARRIAELEAIANEVAKGSVDVSGTAIIVGHPAAKSLHARAASARGQHD
jgi:uncharacterized protein YukE